MVAEGSVSEYDDARRSSIALNFATEANVEPSSVVVTVASGSVVITITTAPHVAVTTITTAMLLCRDHHHDSPT